MPKLTAVARVFSAVKKRFQQTSLFTKIIVILIVIGLGWFFFGRGRTTTAQSNVQTAQVERGTLVISVTASGQVSAVNSASATTQSSGVITKLYVQNGDLIESGKPLADIQLDQDSQQRHMAAYASYLSAVNSQKTAEQTKLTLQSTLEQNRQAVIDAQNTADYKNANSTNPSTKRDYTDLEKQSIDSALTSAHETFSATERKYLDADTAVNAARASVSSTWLTYQQTSPQILAPISGTVTGMSLQQGTVITQTNNTSSTSTANGNTGSSEGGQKVATITTDAAPMVTVNLTEIDAPKIKMGNRATITLDAFAGKTYTGKVISVDTAGSVSSGVTTYPTVIQLDTNAPEIYPNMSASASIITQTKDNVLLVPSSAVQTQNGESTVRVMRKGQMQEVPVEVGDASDTQTEITSGLQEGDTVVTSIINTPSGTQNRTGSQSPFSGFGGGGRGGGFGGGGAQRFVR